MKTPLALQTLAEPALAPVRLNTSPLPSYGPAGLDYGMTIGIEKTPQGRLWACWVGGGDNEKAFFVLARSEDGGKHWSPPLLVVDPHDEALGMARRTLVGTLWLDPLGRLWLFFDQAMTYFDGRAGLWATRCDEPDAESPQWREPERLWDGCVLNKPLVLSNGEWLLNVSLWDRGRITEAFEGAFPELDPLRGLNFLVSQDQGQSWHHRGHVFLPAPEFDESHTVERGDGSLWVTARTGAGVVETISQDCGRSWSEPGPTSFANARSRHFMRRLRSGRLLLVKHGEEPSTVPFLEPEGEWARTHLTAFLSDDDGASWQGGLLLEERHACSYPDGVELEDGTLLVSYDFQRCPRGEILFARFTEQAVLARDANRADVALRQLISRPEPEAVYRRLCKENVNPRWGVHHWKTESPAALCGGHAQGREGGGAFLPALRERLKGVFAEPLELVSLGGTGNHYTYRLHGGGGVSGFVRLAAGQENDRQMEIETRLMAALAQVGIPVPTVLYTDTDRRRHPFALQVLEYLECSNLQSWLREGKLDLPATVREIGRNVARWQAVPVRGFGAFDPSQTDGLHGVCQSYRGFYLTYLERHLQQLRWGGLLSPAECKRLRAVLVRHLPLLDLEQGVLVHRDLALWNIMGTPGEIRAFIDWDDAIAGDPCDDLSLLACFYPPEIVAEAVAGYTEVRPLPEAFETRLRLHLLRNMIVKGVIRLNSGYFDRPAESLFLLSPGQDGAALREMTRGLLLNTVDELEAL